MFQKLARATIFAASVILVISRIASTPHPEVRSAQDVFIASQMQIRRS
ncbi:MAG TPA: hypothetical protein VL354_22095 [Spirochaetia bacterium]|nr:hypothetical protein [Spirochaetia bacterium]